MPDALLRAIELIGRAKISARCSRTAAVAQPKPSATAASRLLRR
jgi:hypothetical protein